MFQKGDLCVLNSKTSINNGKVVEVLGYTHGKCDDILRVSIRSRIFNINESSLCLASKYDLIRNLSDKQLRKLLRE